MQPTNPHKVMHWIRHDNAQAWGRWATTSSGRVELEKSDYWVREIWQASAWKILEAWEALHHGLAQESVSLDLLKAAHILTRGNQKSHVALATTKTAKQDPRPSTWGFYEKTCEAASKNGWVPSGHWGWVISKGETYNSLSKHLEWAKKWLVKIAPSDRIRDSKSDVASVAWLDWLLAHPSEWAKEVCWGILKSKNDECQALHANWPEFVLGHGVFASRTESAVGIRRVGEALVQGLLTGPLPNEEALAKVLTWNRRTVGASVTNDDSSLALWTSWIEREKLRQKERPALDNSSVERGWSAL